MIIFLFIVTVDPERIIYLATRENYIAIQHDMYKFAPSH